MFSIQDSEIRLSFNCHKYNDNDSMVLRVRQGNLRTTT